MTPGDRLALGVVILAVCGHVALVHMFQELFGGALLALRRRKEGRT